MKPEELICKAQRKDNGEWIEGFYFCLHHNDGRTHLHHFIIPLEADLSKGTPLDKIQVEIEPESIVLKALQPRLMTLNEVEKWVNLPDESKNPIFVEYGGKMKFGHSGWRTRFFGFAPKYNGEVYGVALRCWTSRPPIVQRMATPWK